MTAPRHQHLGAFTFSVAHSQLLPDIIKHSRTPQARFIWREDIWLDAAVSIHTEESCWHQ